ncbi:hypothetical protein CSKR_100016 [Clonorchis sinensis]|uniref:Uncharacterized protein n=1 Tax=Clonorchis sinensis TaxID=79923 RepID=A0A3R7CNF0_CLOSI|nr:hypothetical protein CSKR_100016 [Clonorchis sinensis]
MLLSASLESIILDAPVEVTEKCRKNCNWVTTYQRMGPNVHPPNGYLRMLNHAMKIFIVDDHPPEQFFVERLKGNLPTFMKRFCCDKVGQLQNVVGLQSL